MTSTKQGDLGAFSSSPTEDQNNKDSQELRKKLTELGLNKPQVNALVDEFNTIEALINATDNNITSIKNVGSSTLETVRQNLDPTTGDNYTVVKEGEGYTFAQWTEEADERKDILTAEFILEELLSSNEFGHHSKLYDAITDWARNEENEIADELKRAAYSLTPSDINFGSLFDPEEEYDSIEELEEQREKAVLKSRAVMAFCDLTGRKNILAKGEDKAQQKIEDEEREKQEKREKKEKAADLLSNPPQTINDWEHIKTPEEEVYAYNGYFNDDPAVVALFEDDEYVRIRVYSHEDWSQVDWSAEKIGDELYDKSTSATGKTPKNMQEGIMNLVDFTEWIEFDQDTVAVKGLSQ